MTYPIVKYPADVLTSHTDLVTEFGSDLAIFVASMFRSMYAAQGIGLAAPQVGISKRIAVIDITFGADSSAKLVLINPEIVKTSGFQRGKEGCLSLPGFREDVKRPRIVTVRAQDETGNWRDVTGEDLLARAIVHECDHLKGQLFFVHLSRLKRDMIRRKARRQSGQ